MRITIVAVMTSMVLAGCADPPKEDGRACDHANDCASKQCQHHVCVGGACDGSACPSGFECHYNDGGFLSNGSYGCDMVCSAGVCPFAGFECGDDNHCYNTGGPDQTQQVTSEPDPDPDDATDVGGAAAR